MPGVRNASKHYNCHQRCQTFQITFCIMHKRQKHVLTEKNNNKKRKGSLHFTVLGSSGLWREWKRRNDSLNKAPARAQTQLPTKCINTILQREQFQKPGSIIKSMLGLWAVVPDVCVAHLLSRYLELLAFVTSRIVYGGTKPSKLTIAEWLYWFGKWIQDSGKGDDTTTSLITLAPINNARIHNMCSQECRKGMISLVSSSTCWWLFIWMY